jgi:4'-phosphopantetheinyl transferase EntD
MSISLYWLTLNLADVPADDDWLGDRERKTLAGFRFAKRRNDWRLGRWTSKRAICACHPGRYPTLSSLEIRAAADGAPEAFVGGEPAGISFSISHSDGRGFCVVGPPEFSIGCDMERIEEREERFAEDYFTSEEIAFCENARVERKLATSLIWSAKEATLKALREGLRRDTRSILIRSEPSERKDFWNPWTGFCLESSRTFSGWWRSCGGYIYTLTSNRPTSPPEPLQA